MSSLCSTASYTSSQIDRSQYLPSTLQGSFQNSQGTVPQFSFTTSPSLTGLFQTNESISTPAFIDGSIQYLGFDNGFGNWTPGQTFNVNYAELCPCTSNNGSLCNFDSLSQMGNFAGPYSNNGLDNYKIAFCSSTATNGYGCTGLFQNLSDGKIDYDPTVFGSLYNPVVGSKTGFDETFWRVGNPIPLGKTLTAPDNTTTLDSMQLYFNMPSEGGVQPCGVQYPSNATQTNEWWSYGDIGKVFEFDPQLGACSQRVVCPGGICAGDFPRKTPDGPINYWDDVHDYYSGIVIQDSKDNNTGNANGYGNDLFCEVFYGLAQRPGENPKQTFPMTVNRQVQQTDTSFPTSLFGNITLYDAQTVSTSPQPGMSPDIIQFNSPSNYAACSKPLSDFPYGNFFTVNNPVGASDMDYVSWNCQVSNPQIIPFSTQSSSNASTVKENNNQVPPGYFYWDENDVNGGTNVGDWSSMTYNGNPIPGIGFTVQGELYSPSMSRDFYGGNAGGNRTFNLSGAGYNKATQRTKPASGNGPGYAVRTFCPSLYGPLGAGRQYCGFGGAANIPGSDANVGTSTPIIYTNLYNGQDPNCAVNAQMYALANEYDYAQNNWMPEDWKLYYMYLDEYGMDGNSLCPLLGDTCKNKDEKPELFIEPTCVNCLAGNFAYGVMYDGGDLPNSGGAYDSSLIMANGTPMNMRGNMQSASYPGFSDPGNNLTSPTSPSVASSLMGCDRMIGYQTVGYNGKTIGVHATCACTSSSACYCWNTAGDFPDNGLPAIYNPQGPDSGGDGSGGEGNCWIQEGYDNNINKL